MLSNKEEQSRMKILVIILLLLTERTSAVNFTSILQTYALVCGQSHLCNRTTFTGIVFPIRSYDGPIFCPTCACDRHCMQRGDCCPDAMFPHSGLECLNLALFNPKNIRKHALALIECPAETPKELAERCSGNYTSKDTLTLTPVSSTVNLVVYRNKFCAECFVEDAIVPWSLNIDCPGMIDLNHLTSHDAILDMIEDNSCSLIYQSPNHQKYVSCDRQELKNFNNIEECNTTSAWVTYDPDIEWACLTLDQPYKHYRNIFCYMCNPGQHRINDQVVGRCNETRAWTHLDTNLQHACETAPTVPEAYPFKNVFCRQCNQNTNGNAIFLDATVDIESDEHFWGESELKFEITSFNNLQVHIERPVDRLATGNTTNNSSLYDMAVARKEVDIQRMLLIHFLHYGHQMYCDKTLSFADARDKVVDNVPVCGCDVTCVLTSDCCTDFAMTSPVTVPKYIAGFVVSKCYNTTDMPYLLKSCEDSTTDASFADIPITSRLTGVVYWNVYCFLCNEGHDLLPSQDCAENVHISLGVDKYVPLHLNFECKFLIKYEEYFLLSEFIRSIENMGQDNGYEKCIITISPYERDNRMRRSTISTCNVTGQWDVYDPDVKWACENYIPDITLHVRDATTDYSNIFCRICNTNASSETTTDTCKEKGHAVPMSITLATRCEIYPRTPSMPVYKNRFCAECYPIVNKNLDTKQDMGNSYTYFKQDCHDNNHNLVEFATMVTSTYRKMFTFKAVADNAVLEEAKNTNVSGRCQNDEVFDSKKGVCRPLHCSEGKYLTRNACLPFLPHTTLLGYTMAVRMEFTFIRRNNDTVRQLMLPLPDVIKNLISTKLNIGHNDIEYVSMYIFFRQGCDSSIDPTGQQLLLHTSFFIAAMVDRKATEDKLVNMTSSNFSVTFQDMSCDVKMTYDQEALELPTTIHTTDLEDRCFLVSHEEFSYASDRYKLNYVSKFLACQHVEIDGDQYESENSNFHVNLLPNGPRLHFGEFRKSIASKRIQICRNDFEKLMTLHMMADEDSIEKAVKYVLQVISFVCVCLSILGLFATFLTYCFFPVLRTMPGKNNMCLIVTLFLSQFLTQVGISQPKDKMLCAGFGLAIHYLWLATFFSMNVCSYHMFQAFVFPLNQIKNKKGETFTHLRYLCYCLGVPAVIIAAYVTISVSEYGSIGYGSEDKCFISYLPAFIATFIGPVFLICLVNIVLFSATVYNIAQIPHVASNRSSRREVSIHIKLFLLTGISWIFQLIDSFVPLSAFSIIVNFVNASQGIFLFIAYSVNRRVRSYYLHGLSSRFTSKSSVTKSNTSSSVTKSNTSSSGEQRV